jgi:hypothetical protein
MYVFQNLDPQPPLSRSKQSKTCFIGTCPAHPILSTSQQTLTTLSLQQTIHRPRRLQHPRRLLPQKLPNQPLPLLLPGLLLRNLQRRLHRLGRPRQRRNRRRKKHILLLRRAGPNHLGLKHRRAVPWKVLQARQCPGCGVVAVRRRCHAQRKLGGRPNAACYAGQWGSGCEDGGRPFHIKHLRSMEEVLDVRALQKLV